MRYYTPYLVGYHYLGTMQIVQMPMVHHRQGTTEGTWHQTGQQRHPGKVNF